MCVGTQSLQIKKKDKLNRLETSNWKVRINRSGQNVWLRGKTQHSRQTDSFHFTQCRPTRSCTYMRGRHARQAGSRVVCHMATVYKQSVLPLLDTGAILASSSDVHCPSVRSPCRGLQAKVTGSHSSGSLAFCPRVGVVRACPPVRRVCVGLVCLSCHKLHSVAGETSQEELR